MSPAEKADLRRIIDLHLHNLEVDLKRFDQTTHSTIYLGDLLGSAIDEAYLNPSPYSISELAQRIQKHQHLRKS